MVCEVREGRAAWGLLGKQLHSSMAFMGLGPAAKYSRLHFFASSGRLRVLVEIHYSPQRPRVWDDYVEFNTYVDQYRDRSGQVPTWMV